MEIKIKQMFGGVIMALFNPHLLKSKIFVSVDA